MTDVRCSDIQGKKFRCPIPIPMFRCSVMLNYAGDVGDRRRQLTIVSLLAGQREWWFGCAWKLLIT